MKIYIKIGTDVCKSKQVEKVQNKQHNYTGFTFTQN